MRGFVVIVGILVFGRRGRCGRFLSRVSRVDCRIEGGWTRLL